MKPQFSRDNQPDNKDRIVRGIRCDRCKHHINERYIDRLTRGYCTNPLVAGDNGRREPIIQARGSSGACKHKAVYFEGK